MKKKKGIIPVVVCLAILLALVVFTFWSPSDESKPKIIDNTAIITPTEAMSIAEMYPGEFERVISEETDTEYIVELTEIESGELRVIIGINKTNGSIRQIDYIHKFIPVGPGGSSDAED